MPAQDVMTPDAARVEFLWILKPKTERWWRDLSLATIPASDEVALALLVSVEMVATDLNYLQALTKAWQIN